MNQSFWASIFIPFLSDHLWPIAEGPYNQIKFSSCFQVISGMLSPCCSAALGFKVPKCYFCLCHWLTGEQWLILQAQILLFLVCFFFFLNWGQHCLPLLLWDLLLKTVKARSHCNSCYKLLLLQLYAPHLSYSIKQVNTPENLYP